MENFCAYCSVVMTSEEFQAHCLSESHQLMIMSDEGREWKFRPPARGVPADQYTLCPMYCLTGKCRLGQQCCDAHGEEELNEWKERYGYRQMKLQHAKECSLQGSSYTEQLLEKWLTTPNPQDIMKEKLDDVEVTIEPEMKLTVSEKNCCREWTFRISAQATLQHVALLYETHRSHFRLSHLSYEESPGNTKEFTVGSQCQEWSSTENSTGNNNSSNHYICKVRFVTSIYGTFHQAVVFDFGFEPVLVQKLSVDVVSISDLEKLQQARDTVMTFTERWNGDDIVIVPFENRPYAMGEHEKSLLSCYPAPDSLNLKFTVTQAVMEPVLTKENYSARLHELLCIEEMSQHELLSRYNVKARLNLTSCYLLTPNSAATAKYAHSGELFANMKLSSVLSEDSSSGRLILTNCNTVLIAPARTKGKQPRKVYEALIEDKGKTVIYIRLSKQCTEELKLLPDREFMAEVQFQLNRLPLCEMHFAVDRLHPPSLVFPTISSLPPMLWNADSSEWCKNLDVQLNTKQKEAVMAITAPISLRLPPVLIIGPFGTGKTFTLAQAVKLLLSDSQSRVLVCTHSNSAADIYIREYLHPEVAEGRTEATPLRIYYRHRWVATVHPTVLQYCLVSSTECDRTFNMPTVEDVKRHKVIVTTLSTSRYLVQLGLEKGFFTHILIDEAAQAMECEAIMPLSLANENTRIVLAGDHMQLSPEVYSQFAQERNLHTSLLERLYDLYPESFVCKILLCENYRSHEAIIRYTSELFYDNHLIASAHQPRHEKYYPLTFFTARGEDIQDVNSTAYHNNAEVYEIVERVIELKKSWPEVWGDQDETSIGVVTPYYDQVVRIRAELRKKKLHGVSVERVLNVQGKQFRVIFLSAVRTRQTCNGPKAKDSDLDHGFLSNARLLNTAITRAQSLVAVVGDPISLCSVGKCRKLWEKFIHTCHKEKSLFGITWDTLRSHLDSMELKKNFILNPLAPEFVPGRMFHGEPTIPSSSSSSEMMCLPPNATPGHPWLFIPMPSPFQGPPIMQAAVPHVPPPPPHAYNLSLNVGQSLIPPPPPPAAAAVAHPFTFPAAPSIPQASPLQPRMSSGLLSQRLNSPRLPIDQNCQMKELERGLLARAIKRSTAYPICNSNITKQTVARALEDRSRNPSSMAEDPRGLVMRNDLQGGVGIRAAALENVNFQNSIFGIGDKANKPGLVKPEDNPVMLRSNTQAPLDVVPFNGYQEHLVLPHGMKSSIPCTTNAGRLSMPQRPVVDSDGRVFPLEIGLHSGVENYTATQASSQHLNSDFNHAPVADRDKAIVAALDEVLFSQQLHHHHHHHHHHHQQQQQQQPAVYPPHADRWPVANEAASRLDAFQASLQDKLSLLEKILPMGTDLRGFLESAVSPKAFFGHLLTTEGPVVAKRFVNLMLSIKQDQETLIRYQHLNNVIERGGGIRELPNGLSRHTVDSSVLPVRSQAVAPGRPSPAPQAEITNGYDPFRFESPITLARAFPSADKNDAMRTSSSNEGKNGYVRFHVPLSNPVKPREPQQQQPLQDGYVNGPVLKPQEQVLFEMRNMSLGCRNENGVKLNMGPEPAPTTAAAATTTFRGERISEAVRRSELERQMREGQKDLWTPLPSHSEPCPSEVIQDSYLSKLRSMSNTASTNSTHSSSPPVFEMPRRASKGDHDPPAQMTALSVSYPDIPDILPAHLSKESEPTRAVQKPPATRSAAEASPSTQRTSQYVHDIPVQQNNSSTPLSYSTEGMTYAKILRSPHP